MPDLAPQGFLHQLAVRQLGREPLIRPRPRARFEMAPGPEESLSEISAYQNHPTPQRTVERPMKAATEPVRPPMMRPGLPEPGPAPELALVTPPPAKRPDVVRTEAIPDAPTTANQARDAVKPAAATPEPAVMLTEFKLGDRKSPPPVIAPPPAGPVRSAAAEPSVTVIASPRPAATSAPKPPPADQAAAQPPAAVPTETGDAKSTAVHVTIGRVEIRAAPARPDGRSTSRKQPPVRSLDEYLNARQER